MVHEDGRRTLIETILYFEHATRELPLDVILGVPSAVVCSLPSRLRLTIKGSNGLVALCEYLL